MSSGLGDTEGASNMTKDEAIGYIVKNWMLEHSVDRIMVGLICLGSPMTRRAILSVLKRYCEMQSENAYLSKAKR